MRGQALLLGVDRLDPTKGLPERLEAFRRVVARRPARSLTMLQIAAPSREDVAAYRRLRMGIGDRSHGELADYVLATFTVEERQELPAFLSRGVDVVLGLADSGFERLMTAVNAKKSKRELDSQENKHE